MTRRRGQQESLSRTLVDALIDRFVAWRGENAGLADAYDAWQRAGDGERAGAFAAYRAALDREAMAAADYRAAVEAVHAADPRTRSPACYAA